jgi:23S rRNA pseudouridine1911/1915/1917 synthase
MAEEKIDDIELDDAEDGGGEDGLFEHFAVTADRGQSLLRIDKFLTSRMEHVSRARIQAAADGGNILVNGSPVRSNYKVKPLDRIQIVMPYPRREVEIIAENIPLEIVYEDDDLLVVNKEAGLVVHPGHGNYSGTLVNALTWHLRDLPLFQSGDMRAGLVHRIDKNTSGLLVVAKNETAHAKLAKQFFDHTIERRYVALVWGNFEQDEGTITGNIGRSRHDRLKMAVFPDDPDGFDVEGKHAVTHYRVLKRYGYVSLLELRLETGRTHQIRVHMEHTGHPLFNDERYGGDRILKGTTFSKYKQFIENCFRVMPRHALHARSLGFEHPRTRRQLHFEAPLPADFTALLDKWDVYTASRDTFESDDSSHEVACGRTGVGTIISLTATTILGHQTALMPTTPALPVCPS